MEAAGEEASSQSWVHQGQCNCSHQCGTSASPEGVVMVESGTDGDRMDRSVAGVLKAANRLMDWRGRLQ